MTRQNGDNGVANQLVRYAGGPVKSFTEALKCVRDRMLSLDGNER